MKKLFIASVSILSTLALVSAEIQVSIGGGSGQMGSGLMNVIGLAQGVVGQLAKLAIGLAILAFFWFLIKFIWKGSDSATEKEASMKGMGLSIVALFVMFSIYGIIGWLGGTVGVNQGGSAPTPCIPGTGDIRC